jgi:hypothetical protein
MESHAGEGSPTLLPELLGLPCLCVAKVNSSFVERCHGMWQAAVLI